MFTKRKIIKKNIKKNLEDNFNCDNNKNSDLGCNEEDGESENVRVNYKEKYALSKKNDFDCEVNNNIGIEKKEKVKENEKKEVLINHNKTMIEEESFNKKNEKNVSNFLDNKNNEKKEKKKLSSIERKKKEEISRVNKMNTSFHIYSEDDSDSYITIKRKKKIRNSIQNSLISLNNTDEKKNLIEPHKNYSIGNNDSSKSFNEEGESRYAYVSREKHLYNKDYVKHNKEISSHSYKKCNMKNKISINNDNYIYEIDNNNSSNNNICASYTLGNNLKLNDNSSDDINYKRNIFDLTDNYINNIYAKNSSDSLTYELMEDDSYFSEINKNDFKKDTESNSLIYNLSYMPNSKKEEMNDDNRIGNIFMNEENFNCENVMINFEDEKDDMENEEERKLIEEIKLKKKILRKKQEINDNGNIFNDDYISNFSNKKKNNINVNEIGNILLEDDLEVEDIYNYETVNEMKNRLLIKKNKNDEIKNLYEEINTEKDYKFLTLKKDEIKINESYENYDIYEEERINKIVDNKFLTELKKNSEFSYELQKNGISTEFNSYNSSNVNSFHISSYKNDNSTIQNKILDYKYNGKNDLNIKNMKKEPNEDSMSFSCVEDKEDFVNSDIYNNQNKILFEKIKNAFEEKAVCNLEIIKMNDYIRELFDEYKSKTEEYNRIRDLENRNKSEFDVLKSICKKRKKEIIICTIFGEFLQIIINLIFEKSKCVDSALNALYKLEQCFHLVYHNLKLYLYKEYYEKSKLTFINEYIFNSKYYRNKKEKTKCNQLKNLIEGRMIKNCVKYNNISSFDESIVDKINDHQNFNDLSVLYMFDGFSSNYSTDSSLSEYDEIEKVKKEIEENNNEKTEDMKKIERDKLEKQKYFQTLKMRQLKEKFLIKINSIFENVNNFFLNFKNVIKYFYLLKLYNCEFYKNYNCSNCFDSIFFFFVKCELLYWDPLYQFSLKKKKKMKILNYYEKEIKENICKKSNINNYEGKTYINEHFGNICDEQNDFNLYSTHTSDNSNSNNSGINEGDNENSKSPNSESDFSLSSSIYSNEEDFCEENNQKEKKENNINDKKMFSSFFKNEKFQRTKYKLKKKFFHNPNVKSFAWYKLIDQLIMIYDSLSEKEIMEKLYYHIYNKKVYELIEVWNPFSLKQSFNLHVIIKDFILYNSDRKILIDKIKDKINIYITTFLQCYKNICNLKKKNIFLMRCLKILKSIKNVVSLLCDKELFDLVKKIYYDFVLPNYEHSNKFHNLILSTIVHIIHSLNSLTDDQFNNEISNILDKDSKRLNSGYFDYEKLNMYN
ncbi:conserved Plasmodium protein, unknown function [Plasmodium relictum]|uniref:Uncharacterized protein n=1 Tax=Plasmodium relictum TaxID=85471 RepID=A0A1J1H7S4_PLARL|nr:conserved Plasmodium protein, unknown function [Plasmodium relictum]CRH00963.1 conserved Plasmodium protein, unknown function [Plasmodium relictum]